MREREIEEAKARIRGRKTAETERPGTPWIKGSGSIFKGQLLHSKLCVKVARM